MKWELKLKKIVGSRTRAKLIRVFFSNPTDSFYVRQLVRICKEEINSVRRELANLHDIGVILLEKKSNKLFYRPNPKFIFFTELLLIGFKNEDFWINLTNYNTKEGGIYKVICSRNFVYKKQKENESDVDIVIIGKINVDKIGKIIEEQEKKLGFEINYMVMTKKEFKVRVQRRDPLLIDIFLLEPITIMGSYA